MTADLDVAVPCIRCFRPAQQEHHHREGPGPVGKGMGGTHDHLPEVALCRDDHERVHRHDFSFEIKDGWVTGTEKGGKQWEHPLKLDNDNPAPAAWDDAKLALYWDNADASLLKIKATIAHIYKQRFAWGQGWAARAAQILGDGVHGIGKPISERSVRRYANLFDHWDGDWEKMKQLGSVTVAYAVADSEDSEKALSVAVAALDEGRNVRQVVALLSPNSADVGHIEWCTCACGNKHRKQGG